jgi:hypothetical protein
MTQIADANAFFMPTVSEIVWITSLADTVGLQPTAAEVDGGLRLMNELYDVAGFTGSTNWIERRKGNSRVRTQLAGAYTYNGSSITFTADRAGVDAAAEFKVDPDSSTPLTGYLFCAWRGLVAARPAKSFKAEVAPTEDVFNFDTDYMRITIPFGIQKAKDVVVPTGVTA